MKNIQFMVRPRKLQAGLSIVELMVAMAVGLFLIGGALTVYMQSGDTYRTSEKIARIQEVGRYALEMIEPDIAHAGYWGTAFYQRTGDTDPTGKVVGNITFDFDVATTVNIDCGAGWMTNANEPIQIIDGVTVSTCIEATRYAGVDALVIRRASRTVVPNDPTRLQVESTRGKAVVKYSGATAFMSTGAAVPLTTEVRNYLVHTYYVTQVGSEFALRRRNLTANAGGGMDFNPQTLITGVQDLQIELGIDTDGDNIADRYINGALPAGARVIAARVFLLLVGDEREPGYTDPAVYSYANRNFGTAFNDGRRRILLTRTIFVKNAHS